MKIGILGGTFDPPHIAHLQAAQVALDTLELDCIRFLPTGQPPHKDLSVQSPANIRLEMVQAAISDHLKFEISTYEFETSGPHYTVDTLSYFRSHTPSEQITFIVGSDSVAQFNSWRDPDRLFDLAQIAIFERPGYPIEKLEQKYLDRAVILPVIPLNISSSEIRNRVAKGLSIKWLVPDTVECLISRHSLYQSIGV